MDIPLTSILSFSTFLIGLFLGHWLAIGRDKRKEFNLAAEPVRKLLLDLYKYQGKYSVGIPQDFEMDRFLSFFSLRKMKKFLKAWEEFGTIVKGNVKSDPSGVIYFDDAGKEQIRTQMAKCLKFTKYR